MKAERESVHRGGSSCVGVGGGAGGGELRDRGEGTDW